MGINNNLGPFNSVEDVVNEMLNVLCDKNVENFCISLDRDISKSATCSIDIRYTRHTDGKTVSVHATHITRAQADAIISLMYSDIIENA